MPETDDEKILAKCDLLREELKDFFMYTTGIAYSLNYQEKVQDYVNGAKTRLTQFEKVITDKEWFMGKKVTYLDIMAFDVIDHQRILFPNILDDFKAIGSFMERFEKLPSIKNYFNSSRFKKFPLWSERSFVGRSPQNLPK